MFLGLSALKFMLVRKTACIFSGHHFPTNAHRHEFECRPITWRPSPGRVERCPTGRETHGNAQKAPKVCCNLDVWELRLLVTTLSGRPDRNAHAGDAALAQDAGHARMTPACLRRVGRADCVYVCVYDIRVYMQLSKDTTI